MINLGKRILNCIDYKRKKKLFYLQILSILSATLNVFSALLIAPFIAILSGDERILKSDLFNFFFKNLVNSNDDVLIFFSSILIFFYCLNIVMTLIISYLNFKWSNDLINYFGTKLFNFFINKNWLFHTNTSSKILLSKIHQDTQRLRNVIIEPALEIFSNIFLSVFIFFAILAVDFVIAISSILTFTFFYSCFYFLFKKQLKTIGEMTTVFYPKYYKILLDSFASIRDTILFKKKKYFSGKFETILVGMNNLWAKQQFIIKLPRSIIEIIAFSLIIFLIIYLVKFKNLEFAEIGSLIAFYGICTLKVIPALQKIFNGLSIINSHQSAFDSIEKELLESKNLPVKNFENYDNKTRINFTNKIELKNLTFIYPGKRSKGIYDINIEIPFGKKIGIFGQTGSGKSTMIDNIIGLLEPNKGEIHIDGLKLNQSNLYKWQNNLTIVPQKFIITDDTLKKNIAFGLADEEIDDDKVKECLKISCLEEFIDNLDLILGENGERISGGQRQRVAIARALYKESEIIFLDEATSALDTFTEKKILDNLINNKKILTIVIISHRMETLKICDCLFRVSDGKVIKLDNFKKLEDYFK